VATREAIVDRADGWPLAARIARMAQDARGARLARSFTFNRTDSTRRPPPPAADRRVAL
jgi:hypothetical protein